MGKTLRYLIAAAVILTPLAAAAGEKPADDNSSPLLAAANVGVVEAVGATAPAQAPADEWQKPIPLSFSVDYTVVTDYVWRGINYSEYRGEGRELLNHQLGVSVEVDAADLGCPIGSFGAAVWWQWYSGQDGLNFNPAHDDHLQEVDYSLWWSYELAQINTTVELGWIAYVFPPSHGDAHWTHEGYVKLSYDDSALFGTEGGVLNPYFYYGMDFDDGKNGSWMELGISHDFALADIPSLAGAPILKDLTLTPSFVIGIDHRYLDKFDVLGTGAEDVSTRIANLLYGLDISYDLSGALGMHKSLGSISVGGFIYYSQAARTDLLHDEIWGGAKIGYSW